MHVLHPVCAALDVHKASVTACLRRAGPAGTAEQELSTFATTTGELERLRDWLLANGVAVVAMESTGVYWKPVFNVLEGHVQVMLVNAEHYKQVEGRKTDPADAAWLARLLQHGLLQPSFIPRKNVRQLRDLTRQRNKLVQQRAGVVNRVQKVLEDANIKLGDVASDVLGMSGRRMLNAMIRGEDDPVKLAEMALGRLREKIPRLREALRGLVNEHHRFMLRLHLDQVDALDHLIERVSERVLEMLAEPPDTPPSGEGEGGGRLAEADQAEAAPVEAETPAKTALGLSEAVELLKSIPGVKQRTAEVVLAEIGSDMGVFKTGEHLASWAGLCPGNHQSGGKRYKGQMRRGNRWLKQALSQAAWAASRTRGSWLAGRYKRWVGRLGRKRAIMAVAHKLLVLCHWVLSHHTPYQAPDAKKAA